MNTTNQLSNTQLRVAERTMLINELARIQNRPENLSRDIMTIAGMMDNEEIKQHIQRNQ